jgi:8-oxo-dGTP pyrophosphatase MutT (NUDIX family)
MIPKGWPMRGKSLATAAAQEAFEEAGVKGKVDAKPLGTFRHTKQSLGLGLLDVSIVVHPLAVDRELAEWPEAGQRKRKWFSLKQAAQSVDSEELKRIIRELRSRVRS